MSSQTWISVTIVETPSLISCVQPLIISDAVTTYSSLSASTSKDIDIGSVALAIGSVALAIGSVALTSSTIAVTIR